MRELLMMHFSQGSELVHCLLASVAYIALIDILNALSPNFKDSFQFFSGNQLQNYLELFE
jgi:hypothetical protein